MFDASQSDTHDAACSCSACASQALLKTDDSGEVSENYVIYGGKWGDSGTMGTWGGIVTWSLVGAGVGDGTGGQFFSGTTVDMDAYFNFDYVSVLEDAFDAWSQVANIEFIQVVDDGAMIGVGTAAEIRVSAAYMDGPSNTLAAAYLPNGAGTGSQSALVGDVNFDSGETSFWSASSFFLVAVHEIGHALGLSHEQTNLAIMNPYYNSSLSGLQADDIAGIQAIYGVQDGAPATYAFTNGREDLEILSGMENLTVLGNALDNGITGSSASETLIGAGGNDTIFGNDGNDTLIGDSPSNHTPGISLGSGSFTKNGSTGNGSRSTALDVSANFSLSANSDIANATVTPHVSVVAQGSNQIDWYKVTVGADTATITLDIDYGVNSGGSVDTVLTLYDTDGSTILARTDYGPTSAGAGGSTSMWDAFISQTLPGAGTYYFSVGEWTGGSYADSTQGNVDSGDTYTLQISVDGDLPSVGTDTLDGGEGDDTLYGGGGNDMLYAGNGNDWIFGGDGDDHLTGGFDGLDWLEGGDGADFIDGGGGHGHAIYHTSNAGVSIDLANGTASGGHAEGDTLVNINAVNGSAYDDILTGDGGDNWLHGLDGNDIINGAGGNDQLFAGNGLDWVFGGAGNDILTGGLYGLDWLEGGEGADILDGGGGHGHAIYHSSNAGVSIDLANGTASGGHAEGDTLVNINAVNGSAYDDVLTGDNDDNWLHGLDGNDIINGGGGNDQLFAGNGLDWVFGGAGNDILTGGLYGLDWLEGGEGADILDGGGGHGHAIYHSSDAGVTVNLATGTGSGGHAEGDTLANINAVNGSAYDDVLTGDNDDNWLHGLDGNDIINGGGGNDELFGGTGEDLFIFDWNSGNDTIFDWQSGLDTLDFSAANAQGINSIGDLNITSYAGYTEIEFGVNTLTFADYTGSFSSSDFFF